MVISRNGALVHPCINESGVGQSTKPITKRVAELPSLRYGTIGAKTTSTGPLRVSAHYHGETIPRRCPRKSNGHDYSLDDTCYKPIRPHRRVRFDLPPPDGGTDDDGGGDAGVAPPSTAGDGPLRTRALLLSRSTDAVRRSQSAERGSAPSTASNVSRRRRRAASDFAYTSGGGERVHPTGRYVRGTLSPTAGTSPHAAASLEGLALLRAARDGDDNLLRELLRRGALVGIPEGDLNAVDISGRTVLSYIASNGSIDLLEQILQLPGLDPNKPDNEGNTPLHFAAQAGQIECLNCMLSRCRGIEIDARNNLGFTPLMKAALQGRNKCAKLLLFAGANPTLRDNGRGFRADQWARFCGRYVCADVIEKHARQRLLERSTSYGNWGGENELGARVLMGKVIPVPTIPQPSSHGLKSKLRKVFRTSSGPHPNDTSSARLVTQLTSAALCASSPVLPSGPTVPPVVKSLIRPLTVPRLQITLANSGGGGDVPNNNNNNVGNGVTKPAPMPAAAAVDERTGPVVKPARSKKKK